MAETAPATTTATPPVAATNHANFWTMCALAVAYALVRLWYTVAVNLGGLCTGGIEADILASVLLWIPIFRIGLDLAAGALATHLHGSGTLRATAIAAAILLGIGSIALFAGELPAMGPQTATLICMACCGLGSEALYLAWSWAIAAFDNRVLGRFMLVKTGVDALFSPLAFAPRTVVLACCLAMPAACAAGLVAAPRIAARRQTRKPRAWHTIPARPTLMLAAGVAVLFFSFSFSQSTFMQEPGLDIQTHAWLVVAGRWLAFALMAAGVHCVRDAHFETLFLIAAVTAIAGFLARMLNVPWSYPAFLVSAIAATRVAEDTAVMVLVAVSRYSTTPPLRLLAWGRACFRASGWGASLLGSALFAVTASPESSLPLETARSFTCAVEIILIAVAGMWLLREHVINAFLWGRGTSEQHGMRVGGEDRAGGMLGPGGPDAAASTGPIGQVSIVASPPCRKLAMAHGLTERETEILALLLDGRSVPYIQETLHVSLNTAKTHVRHIYQKMDVHNRQELISRAQEVQ